MKWRSPPCSSMRPGCAPGSSARPPSGVSIAAPCCSWAKPISTQASSPTPRWRGIDAYIPVIARLLQTAGGRLLIKPHPYGQRHQDIHTLRGRFPDALTVNDNIYALLHDPGIARMITLSSGVAQEASLLGKAATTLLQPDNRREALGAELVSRDFRIGVAALPGLLRMALDRRSGRPATLTPRPAGHLRRVIGQNWGYAGAPRLSKRCLAPGQTLSFAAHGRGVDLCTMGWSHAEATGLWSDGPFATMLVDTQGRDIDLTLACKAFVPVHGQPLAVHVHIEGADPSPRRLLFHTGRRARLTIALPARRGLTEIVFHLAGVTRPSERGGSADARRLGLYLMTGTVAAPGVRAGAEPVASVSPRRPASAMRAAAAVAALACGFSVGAASLQPPHGKLTVHTFRTPSGLGAWRHRQKPPAAMGRARRTVEYNLTEAFKTLIATQYRIDYSIIGLTSAWKVNLTPPSGPPLPSNRHARSWVRSRSCQVHGSRRMKLIGWRLYGPTRSWTQPAKTPSTTSWHSPHASPAARWRWST